MNAFEEKLDQNRAAVAERMQICEVADGFRVIKSPDENGDFLKVWTGTFQTRRAAELFLEEFLDICVFCDPISVYGTSPISKEYYEETARVWGCLERQGVPNPRENACAFCALGSMYWFRPFH